VACLLSLFLSNHQATEGYMSEAEIELLKLKREIKRKDEALQRGERLLVQALRTANNRPGVALVLDYERLSDVVYTIKEIQAALLPVV
jgi:hypothetical protein